MKLTSESTISTILDCGSGDFLCAVSKYATPKNNLPRLESLDLFFHREPPASACQNLGAKTGRPNTTPPGGPLRLERNQYFAVSFVQKIQAKAKDAS